MGFFRSQHHTNKVVGKLFVAATVIAGSFYFIAYFTGCIVLTHNNFTGIPIKFQCAAHTGEDRATLSCMGVSHKEILGIYCVHAGFIADNDRSAILVAGIFCITAILTVDIVSPAQGLIGSFRTGQLFRARFTLEACGLISPHHLLGSHRAQLHRSEA